MFTSNKKQTVAAIVTLFIFLGALMFAPLTAKTAEAETLNSVEIVYGTVHSVEQVITFTASASGNSQTVQDFVSVAADTGQIVQGACSSAIVRDCRGLSPGQTVYAVLETAQNPDVCQSSSEWSEIVIVSSAP